MTTTMSDKAPLYGVDICASDVDAVRAFLDERIREVFRAHEPADGEYCVADALKLALFNPLYDLGRAVEVDDGSAEMGAVKRRWWNEVMNIADAWKRWEGFDPRWCKSEWDSSEHHAAWQQEQRDRLRR